MPVRKQFLGTMALLSAAISFRGPAQADANSLECKEITARLVEITGASFDHFSPSGANVFLRHPSSEEMVLSCTSHRLTGISVNWDKNGYPDNAWFAFAAKAGLAVTGVDARRIEVAIRRCHRSALKQFAQPEWRWRLRTLTMIPPITGCEI